jgi:hypothetical protein
MTGAVLNPFIIEKEIFDFLIEDILPEIIPKVYLIPKEFLDCYNNNIKGKDKVNINDLCGLVVFDTNRFKSGEIIKEYEEDYSVTVPFYVIPEIGNYRWIRPNIDISITLNISVYTSTIYDRAGTLSTYILSKIYEQIIRKGIYEDSPDYIGLEITLVDNVSNQIAFYPSQLILKNLSPVNIMPANSSYLFRRLQLELRLLNC